MLNTPVMNRNEINKGAGIYSKTTMDYILRPRNVGELPDPDGYAACKSDCGETMEIRLKLDHDNICRTSFQTDGCAAVVACGSMAAELARGRTVIKAMAIDAREIADALVDFPEGNFHCAALAAQTLRAALKNCLEIQRDPWKKFYRK